MDFFLNLFPFLHLVVLIAGFLVLLFVKRRYPQVKTYELVIVFILFCILVAIFSEPGLDLLKKFILLIQV